MVHPGKKTNDKNTAGRPVWRQGYVPQQAPIAQQQKISLATRRRISIHREKRGWLVLLVSGVTLLLVGAALIIPRPSRGESGNEPKPRCRPCTAKQSRWEPRACLQPRWNLKLRQCP